MCAADIVGIDTIFHKIGGRNVGTFIFGEISGGIIRIIFCKQNGNVDVIVLITTLRIGYGFCIRSVYTVKAVKITRTFPFNITVICLLNSSTCGACHSGSGDCQQDNCLNSS